MIGSIFQLKVFLKEFSPDLWPNVIEKLNTFDIYCIINQSGAKLNPLEVEFRFRFNGNKAVLLKNQVLTTKIQFHIEKFCRTGVYVGQNFPLEKLIKEANYVLTLGWDVEDFFSLRFALLISAIITEKFDGICYSPSSGLWQGKGTIIDDAFKEVISFEKLVFTGLLRKKWAIKKSDFNDNISTGYNLVDCLN